MNSDLIPIRTFMENNINVLYPLDAITSYFSKISQLYGQWAHQMGLERDQEPFLSSKLAFGDAMGSLALFALLFFEYRRVVCAGQGGHTFYFEDGWSSGDGRGTDYAHAPLTLQHKKMIELFESLNLALLPGGGAVLDLMKNFKPQVTQNHLLGGKYFLTDASRNHERPGSSCPCGIANLLRSR